MGVFAKKKFFSGGKNKLKKNRVLLMDSQLTDVRNVSTAEKTVAETKELRIDGGQVREPGKRQAKEEIISYHNPRPGKNAYF